MIVALNVVVRRDSNPPTMPSQRWSSYITIIWVLSVLDRVSWFSHNITLGMSWE